METMSNRIEQALFRKNGGNQSELARFVGVTPQAVQKWIAKGVEPRGKNLEKVAEFLGMSPAVLQFGESGAGSNQEPTRPAPLAEAPPPQSDDPGFLSSEDVIKLIDLFSQSTPRGRRFILESASVAEKHPVRAARTRSPSN